MGRSEYVVRVVAVVGVGSEIELVDLHFWL